MAHCEDNEADRATGQYYDRQFCLMAAQYGRTFSPLQIGLQGAARAYDWENGWNVYLLPDVVIWQAPGELHEIKHKAPLDKFNTFGLEVYRFESLIEFMEKTSLNIFYTIHNWQLAGGKDVRENNIDHWVTTNIRNLINNHRGPFWGYSYVNGIKKRVPIYYWDVGLWYPLQQFWKTGAY